MSKIVGYIKEIEGEFVAKSKSGEIRVLHKGDPVYETDLIYNPSKSAKASIDIDLLSTKEDLKLDGKGMVYLEGSTFDTTIPAEDMTLSQADVNSNLRDVKSNNDFIDDVLKEYGDIDINETAIGKEEVLQGGHEVDQFAKIDGAMADVNSDLRNIKTHSYNLEHDFDPFSSSGESGFSPTHLAQAGSLGPQTPPPPSPTNPTHPYTPPQPSIVPVLQPSPIHQVIIPEVSVNNPTINEQNGVAVFTFKSSAPIGEDIIIHYTTKDISATNGDDYTSVSGTAVIRKGETQTTVEVPISDDNITESNENFKIHISGISDNAHISNSDGIATIVDDRGIDNPNIDEDVTASLIISDAGTVSEGGYLVYDVKLSNPVGNDIPVSFTTSGTATPTDDYNPQLQYSLDGGNSWINAEATVDIPADASTIKIRVAVNNDALNESNETVVLQANSSDPRLTDVSDTGTGIIIDGSNSSSQDTVYAKITTDHATIAEDGGNITYTVSLVDKDGNPVTVPDGKSVNVDLHWSGTAGLDDTTLSSLPTSITVNGNTDHTAITVPLKDDYLNEGDESLNLSITNVTDTNNTYENVAIATQANGYATDSNIATTTIQDGTNESDHGADSEDTVYAKITNDDTAVEGGYLTHTVSLVDKDGNPVTVPDGKSVTVHLSYTDNTGLGDSDFRNPRITEVTINGGESLATIKNLTKDDFTQEDTESYTVKVSGVTDNDNSFENVSIANSANGYASDSDSVTGTVKNGVTPGSADSASVDEDSFSIEHHITTISDTGSLNITSPNESNYTLTFEHSVTAKDNSANVITLKSDGKDITYDYSTPGKIVANDSDGAKVFEITLDKSSGNYTYTQYKNLDHPIANSDDNITLSFNYDVNDTDAAGNTYSKTTSFDVVVNDSMPSATNQTISAYEDTSTTIYISDESFENGKITLNNGVDGDQTVSSGSSIDIYDTDKDDVVGSLKNNGDGTLTFTPTSNYSGDTNGFSYSVSDSDGDSANANIAISVTPIADTPVMPDNVTQSTNEDNNNANEGTNVVSLGLTLPSLSNQTDQTDRNGATAGDAHERFGLLEFSFASSHDFGTATLKYDSDGDGSLDTDLTTITRGSSFTIDITDASEYHPANLGSGTYSLTQAQYESLAVVQAEDNANNIIMDIKTKMHEVKDNGDMYNNDIVSNYTTQRVTVDVQAVTDDISLKYNNDQSIGSISTTDNTDDTFTFNAVDEDSSATLIDLKSLLTKVSGTENDTSPDLDGSEHRSYEFSGLPEGSIITLDGVKTAVASDGTATINFPDNTKADPDFTLQIAPNYSGSIDATITLKVTDTDSDSTVTPATKEVSLYLKGDVNPVADEVTLQVKQSIGFEDDGRSLGNTADNNAQASNIDEPQKGIPVDIKVTSDDDKTLTGASSDDNAETYTVAIDKIPDGASLYIADTDGTYYLYDKDSSDAHNVTITDNDANDGYYKVTIDNYNNDTLPKFIPPHNSDGNFTLDITAHSKDGSSVSGDQTLQVDIDVIGVADTPIHTDLHHYDRSGNDDSADNTHIYAEVLDENHSIGLGDLYKDLQDLSSYDQDSNEIISMVISDLPTGFGVSSEALYLGNGRYVISKDDLDNAHINLPNGYAGEANFKLTYVTTETSGNSKTHFTQDVKALVTPKAEASLTSQTNVLEDTQTSVHFNFAPLDSNEALKTIYLKKDDVDNKVFTLKLDGNDLSTTETIDGTTYYKIDANDLSNLTVHYDSDMGSSSDTSIAMKYITTDTVSGLSDGNGDLTDTSGYQDATVNLVLSPVTDGVSIDVNGSSNISGDHITASDGTNGEEEVSINDTGDFTTTLDITALATDNSDTDTDGSEKVTKLIISNVPDGIIVDGGVMLSGGSEATWIVNTNNLAMDSDTKRYDITFKVGTGLYSGTGTAKDITIVAVDKDGNASELTANTKVKFIDNIGGGNGGSDDTISADLQINHPEIIEDTTFYLGDFISVVTDPNDGAGNHNHDDATYSISIKNLQDFSIVNPDGLLSYTDDNGDIVYVISGDESSINSTLSSIEVKPDENLNSNNIGNGSLNADITLNAYMLGAHSHQSTATYNEVSVTPVTDELTPVTVSDSIDEDSSGYNFDITFDSVDKPYYAFSNVVLHINDKTLGTVKLSDGTIVSFNDDGNADIDSSKLTDLTFIPTPDISGQAIFTYKADVQENNASNTLTSVDGGSVTIDIHPVYDGLDLSGLAAVGNEHEYIQLTGIGASLDSDGSESVENIVINNIPSGFVVYYDDNGTYKLALNAGLNGSTSDLDGHQVGLTTWAVPVTGGSIPDIYLKPPRHWSGEVTDIELKVIGKDGSIDGMQTHQFDLDVNPVASDITANATKTFGNEGEDIPLNFNANAKDTDGSESVVLTLKGFGDDKATFKVDGDAVDSSHISYDSSSDTYTITDINTKDINDVSVVHPALSNTTIDFTLQTVDSATINGVTQTDNSSSTVSGSFNINITESIPSSDDDILLYKGENIDALGGNDTLVLNGETIDFSKIHNVETLDLNAGDNNISNLTLSDVVDMTDSNNTLVINGDSADSVSLGGNGWSQGSSVTENGHTYDTYSNSSDPTVTLKIEDHITVS